MTDPAAGLSVLHVVDRASDTNSQFNEHCLPVMHQRRITLCSLFPVAIVPPPELVLFQGDGTFRGGYRALREALQAGTYDVVHAHSAGGSLLTLLAYKSLHRSRQDLVFTIHSSWPNYRLRKRLFLYLVAALFPVVVACGEASRSSLPRIVRRLTRRLEVVPNGVDIDRVDRVLQHHTYAESPEGARRTVLAVNRLIPIKDPDTVMEAFVRAAAPEDRLVMVGEGKLAPRLYAAVQQSGLESQLRFTGLIAREAVYRHMSNASVFVSASVVEGLPVSVLEAMACRCPVVLSDIPAHREIAQHTPGLQLVAPADVDGFAAAIHRALRMSDFERYLVGEELRRVVVQQFSVTAMSEGYGRVYRAVADRNQHPVTPALATLPADDASRRRRRKVAAWMAVAVVGATAGIWYGGSHSPQYRATTTLGVRTPDAAASQGETRAATAAASGLADLVRRQVVLAPVAKRLSVHDWRVLPARVHGRARHADPLVIEVTASGDSAPEAERLAGAVADEMVALTEVRAAPDNDPGFVDRELARLQRDIAQTQHQIDAQLSNLRGVRRDVAAGALTGLRAQLTELQATYQTMVGWRAQSRTPTGLSIVDLPHADAAAWPPSRIALAALGAAAALALVLALNVLSIATREEQSPQVEAGGTARLPADRRTVPPLPAHSPEPLGLSR